MQKGEFETSVDKFDKLLKINNEKLNKILSFVGGEPRFFDNGKKLLSRYGIVYYKEELKTSIKNIIPLIVLRDNEFLVYDTYDDKFMILDISDDFIRDIDSIDSIINTLENQLS